MEILSFFLGVIYTFPLTIALVCTGILVFLFSSWTKNLRIRLLKFLKGDKIDAPAPNVDNLPKLSDITDTVSTIPTINIDKPAIEKPKESLPQQPPKTAIKKYKI